MKKIIGGVTSAKGFLAAGTHIGIKKVKKDLSLIYSSKPAIGAGTFTSNVVKAAPVKWDMNIVENSDEVQAIILNSGVANACTGKLGDENNEIMANLVAESLNIKPSAVFTASTGVIGKQLPIEKIVLGINTIKSKLSATEESGTLAAEAILTTDTFTKESALEYKILDKTITIGGMAKGSGMIHPNMATMLGVITTDINISKELLLEAIREDVKYSFNMISIDGDSSTNDSLLILANGEAGNEKIVKKDKEYDKFCKALRMVTTDLAKQIASDGEGATKLFQVDIVNADSEETARIISKSIITSNLVKTAVFGSDANWGRILCAMGYSGVIFDPDKVDLYIESSEGKLLIVEDGMATEYSEEEATLILSQKEVKAIVDMKSGNSIATAWGCDLTYDYVKINADYRS